MASLSDDWGWAVIFLFFCCLRGCNHADENERKIDSLENEVQSLERKIDRIENR